MKTAIFCLVFFSEVFAVQMVEITEPTFQPPCPLDSHCTSVKCESTGYVSNTCPVNQGNIVHIEVDVEHSNTECTPGKSFFNLGTAIKVTKGCRATFKVCFEVQSTTITCESKGYVSNTCPLSQGNIVYIEVDVQRSNIECTPGKSFFNLGTAIKVTKGCRATFKVCYKE